MIFKKRYWVVALIAITLFVTACGSGTEENGNNVDGSQNADFQTSDVDWRTYELSDIEGKSFTISEKIDKPIFVETFAVWCSNCKKQQQEVTKLHEALGDSVHTIAIEIDPNANNGAVAAYVSDNGFQSQYVVAPQEFTQSLVDEFGAQIVSAPSVPMLFICGEEVTQLRRGVKSSSELQELAEGCNV